MKWDASDAVNGCSHGVPYEKPCGECEREIEQQYDESVAHANDWGPDE